MKLISSLFTNLIEWNDKEILIIKIEDKEYLSSFLFQITRTGKTLNEIFRIYSDNDKELTNSTEVILDPFSISPNNKDVLKYIQTKIKKEISNNLIDLNQKALPIWDFFQSLFLELPVDLFIDNTLVINSLGSLYKIEVEDEAESLLELLLNTIKTTADILDKKIFMFLHLKHFLTEEEIIKLYDAAILEEVNLILIESELGKTNDYEKAFVMDRDLCEIF